MKRRNRVKTLLICGLIQSALGHRHRRSREALFIAEPASQKVIIGGTIRLACSISGIPTSERNSSVQWSQNNFALGFPPLRNARYLQQNGPEDYSLEIVDAELDDSGEYECQAHTSYSRLRSQSARLEVLQPPEEVSIVPASGSSAKQVGDVIEVVEGVETKLQCVSSASKPKTQLDWIFQDRILNGSEIVTGERIFTTLSETWIKARRADHGREIQCRAQHEALDGTLARTMILNVKTLPDIEVQLNAQNYRVGDSIQAKCIGTANPPIDRFAWYIGNQLIEEQTGAELLMVKGAQRALNGEPLRCQAFNEVGDSTADSLLNVEYAPDIVAPTLDSARRIVANKSDTVTLRCQFDGNPAPAISWYYHEQEIARGDASLVLERVRQGDGGEYKCKAESILGAAENVLTLVVRGAPIITSEPEQYGDVFQCGFISEPPALEIAIVDMDAESTEDAIIYQGSRNEAEMIEINPGTGRYECRVRNDLGTTTKFIVLHPSGVSTESRIAIILAVLILLIIFTVLIILRMKFYPREQRFKVSKPDDHTDQHGHDFNAAAEMISSRKDSLLLGYGADHHQQRPGRPVPEDKIITEPLMKHSLHQPDAFKITPNQLSTVVVESSSSERSHSGNDDGYGTESGSNHKNDHSSQSESNSDFEINVPNVETDGSEYSKIRVKITNGNNVANSSQTHHSSSDESGSVSYQPQNMRSQTEKIQYQNYMLTTKMNRVRSVSHV